METFIDELRALLSELDKLPHTEDLDELNATLEDVILMLEDADDEDVEDVVEDALEELNDLYAQYSRIPGMFPYSERLKDIAASIQN